MKTHYFDCCAEASGDMTLTVTVETQFGAIDVKVAYINSVANNGAVNAMPEFEQCRAAAKKASVPLREVREAARAAYMVPNGER